MQKSRNRYSQVHGLRNCKDCQFSQFGKFFGFKQKNCQQRLYNPYYKSLRQSETDSEILSLKFGHVNGGGGGIVQMGSQSDWC